MRNNYSLDKSNAHDLAIHVACEIFEQMYPQQKQPTWLKYCMAMRITKNSSKNWVVKMILRPKYQLQPNMHLAWQDDGFPMMVDVEPNTGKESIVICCGPYPDDVVFFEVEVDSITNSTTILVDCDPNSLDGDLYEINRR